MSPLGLWLAVVFLSAAHRGHCIRENRYLTANVTHTLDTLLANNRYDKRIRPDFGGPPLVITVNLAIKSMGPVSENDQSFGLDCYFRQHWHDLRLQFPKLPGIEEFSMSWLFLDKVWKPDTYFVNGKKSYLHRITAPNKFLRLRHDGFITYSMRLTITASCPMYLRKFPLDAQRCPLVLGSYGYPKKDLVYQWNAMNALELEPGVELAQFDLVNVTKEVEKTMMRGDVAYSTVQANFWLKRHTGYFMLQVYVPCGLIVLCSWVSFWIDPDDVAARVALGVTTVLSLTTMGFGGRAQLPKVSYWTALDWFVIICFTSVFSVMIEYAIVNFIDKVQKDLTKIIQKRKEDAEKKKAPDDDEVKRELAEFSESNLSPDGSSLVRVRSASLSVITAVDEQPCRRISIAGDTRREERVDKVYGSRLNLTDLGFIRTLPRRLSVNVTELQQKIARSIQNLTKEEKSVDVPRLVVTGNDGEDEDTRPEDQTVLDLEQEDSEWEPADEPEDADCRVGSLVRPLMHPVEFWANLKILPQEEDVVRLMESLEPPDKFSRIDIQSRRSFPLVFFTSLTIYLVAFAYYLTDDFPERDSELLLHKQ